MGKLHDEAEAIGVELDPRWNAGAIRRAIARRKEEIARKEARETTPAKTTRVRLLKNTQPPGWYRVVGHYDAEERFVPNEPAPPPFPGVNFPHKLWANTVVELPVEVARKLVENIVIVDVVDRDPDTKSIVARRKVSQRKPLAEIAPEWEKSAVGFEVRESA